MEIGRYLGDLVLFPGKTVYLQINVLMPDNGYCVYI